MRNPGDAMLEVIVPLLGMWKCDSVEASQVRYFRWLLFLCANDSCSSMVFITHTWAKLAALDASLPSSR